MNNHTIAVFFSLVGTVFLIQLIMLAVWVWRNRLKTVKHLNIGGYKVTGLCIPSNDVAFAVDGQLFVDTVGQGFYLELTIDNETHFCLILDLEAKVQKSTLGRDEVHEYTVNLYEATSESLHLLLIQTKGSRLFATEWSLLLTRV
jgi:hypothetical protein